MLQIHTTCACLRSVRFSLVNPKRLPYMRELSFPNDGAGVVISKGVLENK